MKNNTGNICNKCGKPYTYVGDVFDYTKGQEPWCTCNEMPSTILDKEYTHNCCDRLISELQAENKYLKAEVERLRELRLSDLKVDKPKEYCPYSIISHGIGIDNKVSEVNYRCKVNDNIDITLPIKTERIEPLEYTEKMEPLEYNDVNIIEKLNEVIEYINNKGIR